MIEDEIAALRKELAGLSGAARAQPLFNLGHLNAYRYWQVGTATAAALPYLDASIQAFDESHGHLPRGDTLHASAGAALGRLLGVRHALHGGGEADRVRAVELLEESLTSGALTGVETTMTQMALGDLHLAKAVGHLGSAEVVLAALRSGGAPDEVLADLDGAATCFTAVVAAPGFVEGAQYAQTMLEMTTAIRALLSGFGSGFGGFDLGRMAEAVSMLQRLQQGDFLKGLSGVGVPPGPPTQFAEYVAKTDVMDRPVGVVLGERPADQARPGPPRPRPVVDAGPLRQELRTLLPTGDDHLSTVVTLLQAGDQPPWLDDFVALTAGIVAAAGDGATGRDHLLYASALYLRSRRDGDGWAEEDREPFGGDAAAAVPSLLAAAQTLPTAEPDSIPALLLLASLLPGDSLAAVTARLSGLATALRAVDASTLLLPEPAGRWRLRTAADGDRLEALSTAADIEDEARPGRVVTVGDDPPGPDGDVAVLNFSSLTQLTELAGRRLPMLSHDAVFVANPRGDRERAGAVTMVLRRLFHPGSTGFGRLVEDATGVGTPAEVRSRLQTASLLHLDCGVTPAGALELADATELDAGTLHVTGDCLAILPPGCFQPLADLLLAAGCAGVIGWLGPVHEPAAALVQFVLHSELVDHDRAPAEALREVRRWARRPDDRPLPSLLADLTTLPPGQCEAAAAALVYRGV